MLQGKRTALHIAAYNCCYAAVNKLIQYKANISATDVVCVCNNICNYELRTYIYACICTYGRAYVQIYKNAYNPLCLRKF